MQEKNYKNEEGQEGENRTAETYHALATELRELVEPKQECRPKYEEESVAGRGRLWARHRGSDRKGAKRYRSTERILIRIKSELEDLDRTDDPLTSAGDIRRTA